MTLEQLPVGESGLIEDVLGQEALRARLLALGLRVGREVAVIRRAWLGGPLHIRVGSTDIALRRKEAKLVRLAPARGPS